MTITPTDEMLVGFGMSNFSLLKNVAIISGVRAYDMALRLQYDDISIGKIDTNISKALEDFINTNPDEPKTDFL